MILKKYLRFQVLDARDPMGSRCKEVEEAVIGASKKLILVNFMPEKSTFFLLKLSQYSMLHASYKTPILFSFIPSTNTSVLDLNISQEKIIFCNF